MSDSYDKFWIIRPQPLTISQIDYSLIKQMLSDMFMYVYIYNQNAQNDGNRAQPLNSF